MVQKSTTANRLPRALGIDDAAIAALYVLAPKQSEFASAIHLLPSLSELPASLTSAQKAWANLQFAAGNRSVLVPDDKGQIAFVLVKVPKVDAADPFSRMELALGSLAATLPAGRYALATEVADPQLAAIAWGLGAYVFTRYKAQATSKATKAQLVVAEAAIIERAKIEVSAVWLGRDLINTPASDMSPAQLESEARALAKRHAATATSVVGDDLLSERFPMIHAVGRAALDAPNRAPRLVDLRWAPTSRPSKSRPKITLVGKGITFDTGGLDIKPASAMLLMKKDMGGAAAALAAAHMIMALGLEVDLRVILAIAENAIAGDAFRPGDVLATRSGKTVEIGNTDAEGRLVLGDALTLADEEHPDLLVTFATLTGAARTALGPDLPPFYTDAPNLARQIDLAGREVVDPVWQLPLWPAYESYLESAIADSINSAESPFAGSITAALFLKRFVQHARRFAHFDIYGWRPQTKPLGPKGGEPQVARAIVNVVAEMAKAASSARSR